MKFSFIESRKKSIIGNGIKIWFVSILLVEIMLIISNILIGTQVKTFAQRKDDYINKVEKLDDSMKKLFNKQRLINKESKIAEGMRNSNTQLKSKIKKIFDLTPKNVVFQLAIWGRDDLMLEGYTPTKEDFNFLLQTTLEEIYGSTKTSFFPRKTGGFNFSSKNVSKERSVK